MCCSISTSLFMQEKLHKKKRKNQKRATWRKNFSYYIYLQILTFLIQTKINTKKCYRLITNIINNKINNNKKKIYRLITKKLKWQWIFNFFFFYFSKMSIWQISPRNLLTGRCHRLRSEQKREQNESGR